MGNIIYTTDIHSTVNPPISRIDDFVNTQVFLFNWLKEQIKKYKAIHLCGGDVGDKDSYKNADMMLKLINLLLLNFPKTIGILGNHDLKYRNWKYVQESFISAIINAGIYDLIQEPYEIQKDVWIHPFNWGKEISHIENLDDYSEESKHIALYHGYVANEKNAIADGYYAETLMYNFPEYDMFLTGDNHTKFVVEYDGQVLINGGSFYRKSIDQIEHEPVIWLIDLDNLSYKEIAVPDPKDAVSTEHKDIAVEKRNTMDSVVSTIKNSGDVELSFENKLEEIMKENVDIMNDEIREMLDKVMEVEEIYVR